MTRKLSRKEVAKEIGVSTTTLYRWEKRGISPVTPKRLVRTNELIYTADDVETLRAWMNRTEDAMIGQNDENPSG